MGSLLQSKRKQFGSFLITGQVIVVSLLFLILASESLAQSRLEIFTLNNRMAEELIPVIQPMLSGSGTVSGMNRKLFVRGTPDDLEAVRQLLEQLDVRPKNLRIFVRQASQSRKSRSQVDVSADIPIGDGDGRVVIPPSRGGKGGVTGMIGAGDRGVIGGTVQQRNSRVDDGATQQVTTLDGRPATIYIGQRIPIQQTVIQNNGIFSTRSQGITFQDVTTGFSVLPKLNGNRVTLEISPQKNQLGARGIQVQEMYTTVSGRLGEWMEIGGLVQSVTSSNQQLLGAGQSQSDESRSVLLKVEVAE